MTVAESSEQIETPVLPELLKLCADAAQAAGTLLEQAKSSVYSLLGGAATTEAVDGEQTAAHGLAWLATYVVALRELHHWAERLDKDGRLSELEALILQCAFGEYLSQIWGGIPMSQNEIVRPDDMAIPEDATHSF